MLKISAIASKLKKQPLHREIKLIKKSKLFDIEWYLSQYPDVGESGQDPIEHYLHFGAAEGRFPNPDFDTLWYLNQNEDVAKASLNPLVHYITNGKDEGRITQPNSAKRYTSLSNVGDLCIKLWGGFSCHALKQLIAFSIDSSNSNKDRVTALYSLARWYASAGEWAECQNFIKQIRPLDLRFYRNKRVKLLLVESYIQQGLTQEAIEFIEPTLELRFDSDFICALSNLPETDEERLETVNKIYHYHGLTELSFADKSKGMVFGNVVADVPEVIYNSGPKISILVPVYKAEEFISVAITSLLAQSWQNIEIIAVDDCSPDRSLEILQELAKADSRLKVYKNDENLGAYGTRNRALSLATGDFITVHDSDDWSHPQMLEIQMGAMMSEPRLKLTCSMMARVYPDMRFILRPQRNNLDYVHRSYPSVLIRAKDLKALGQWDGVSANADDEFVQRARILWGKDSVKDILQDVPLSFFLVHENSLTQDKKTSLNSLTFGIRQEYSRQANYWKAHKVDKETGSIHANRESLKKPFPIPAGLAPNNWQINTHYDLIIISDLSLLGGTRRCNEGYIAAALESGLRVGLFHWPRYDLKLAEIAQEYTELTYNNNVDMLVHEDEVSANLVLIHHPPILKYEIDKVPTIDCNTVGILVNQSPMQLWSESPHYYTEESVNELCLKLFHKQPVWIAISAVVEKTLKMAGGGNHMHNEIWFPPYSHDLPEHVPAPATDFGTDRPIIIGRHSRDHWTKWPGHVRELKQAYCADVNNFDVRILGGAATPIKLLGKTPENWNVLKFDSIEVSDFISELDFFLHFTNEEYIEEFGRNIMEAMAAGKVVILPKEYEIVFGESAVYCNPDKVPAAVKAFWADKSAYTEQAEKALKFVEDNCSKAIVRQKLTKLIK